MSSKTILISFLLFFAELSFAGEIHGLIKDAKSSLILENVLVKIENTELSTVTRSAGNYRLSDVPAGTYYLVFIIEGYYSLIIPDVIVKADGSTLLNTEMYPGNENEYLFLEIGGIQVTANRELIPQNPETIQHISSGEIEHMQANSLVDVLDRLPGNERTQNLGLQSRQQITLRTFSNSGDDGAALFGTKVVVDDVPLNNNIDLNVGTGVGYGSKVTTSGPSGSQYDLREVVAENIESVEVMAGASSVEYGDHSQGMILVKTKSNNVPTRLKLRSNPDTQEANMMGGFNLWSTDFVYNFNYGYSERDIRVSGDEYHRLSGQLKTANRFMADRLGFNQIFYYGRRLEEDNDDSDPTNTRAYNRDHHLTYSHIFDFNVNSVSNFYMRNYVNYRQRNSWRNKLESTDLAYLTDRITPGTREGILGEPSYRSDITTTGEEWSFGLKIKMSRKLFLGETLHNLLVGIEFQSDRNVGAGKQYDILRPPGGNQGIRPRRFDEVPGQSQFSLFADDQVTGYFMLPYTFNLGFRLESYNPQSFNISNVFENNDVFEASQGAFFNPRVGLKLSLAARTQFRFTFSKASKLPALSLMYPDNFYLDVYDHTIQQVADGMGGSRDSNITLVTTSVFDRSTEDVHGYQSTKFEAGFDHQFGDFGFSLVGYHQKTNGIPYSIEIPFMYSTYYWPDWPDNTNKEVLDTYTTVSTKYKRGWNVKWTLDRGIELYIQTHRIKPLNMIFRINAAFKHKSYGGDSYPLWGNVRNYQEGDTLNSGWVVPEDMQLIPFYKPYDSWRQQMVINYSVDYIAKPLGIWFTFRAQQVVLEKDLDRLNPDESASGFYRDGNTTYIDPEMSYLMELDRTYGELGVTVDQSKSHPKWLFSVNVSKELFKGTDISVFIQNIFNDRAYYMDRKGYYRTRNPEIFWGVAFSSKIDDWF